MQYAIDFATVLNAGVYVFRAYNVLSKAGTMINLDEIIERETNLYLRTIISNVNRKNVAVKMITAKGEFFDKINAIDKNLVSI